MLINKNSHWKKELIELRSIFKKDMNKDLSLRDAFSKLTPGKQRDYADHIEGAKREATQIGRLEKSIPMILEGKVSMISIRIVDHNSNLGMVIVIDITT